jgi:hypothetical protein
MTKMVKREESKEKKLNLAEYRRMVKRKDVKTGQNKNNRSISRHKLRPSLDISVKTLIITSLLIVSIGINWGIWNIRYSAGSTDGYELGHDEGYGSGINNGKNAGYSSGFDNGYDIGVNAGTELGYDEGYRVGLTNGENSGYFSGYTDGNVDGFEDGYVKGVEDGVGRGFTIRDPTYQEVIGFIQTDKTDEMEYIPRDEPGYFVCGDFASTVKRNAFELGYRCFYVTIDYPGGTGHAINGFNTTDQGFVYVESQSDYLVNLRLGYKYWASVELPKGYTMREPDHDDTVLRIDLIP